MRLMIFYPGGVSFGTPLEDSNEEIFDIMYTAATIEEGNGSGKIKKRNDTTMDDRTSRET